MSLLRALLGRTTSGQAWLQATILTARSVVSTTGPSLPLQHLGTKHCSTSVSTAAADGPSSSSPSPSPHSDALVAKLFSRELMNRQEQFKSKKAEIIERFQRFPGDVGSCEIQVAIFTEKIRSLEPHFRAHRKDHSSRRGLTKLIHQRRKLLEYMRASMFERYMALIQRLGLKDVYFKQARLDSYKLGTRLGTPAEPRVRHTRVSTAKEADKAKKREQERRKRLALAKGRR